MCERHDAASYGYRAKGPAKRATRRTSGTQGYAEVMDPDARGGLSLDSRLRELRQRADDDFLSPPPQPESGRHQAELQELGLRVGLTRSRYPNRPDGRDLYAVTISRLALDHPPEEAQTRRVLVAAFGELASDAVENPNSSLVRMYRVPAPVPQGE